VAEPTQALRRIAIHTPLGQDVLLVRRCSVQEQISRLFRIDLELISKKNNLNFDDLIGKSATVRLELPNQQTRYFDGFVSRFVQTRSERSYSAYRATLVPWLWFLTRTSDCRIFQKTMPEPPDKMTVPGILKKVFKDFGFENFRDDGLSQTYREWDFCVQYRETAFNFVSRLMEQEGIAYFFEHEEDKHTLVLTDSINAHTTYQNYETVPYHPPTQGSFQKEAVTDWVVEKEVQPGTFSHNDYNFDKPKQSLQRALVVKSTISRPHDKSDFEIYDYPGEFLEHDEGETIAKVRIQELQTHYETLHGQASALGLCAGCTFKLRDHPRSDQNREYLITSTACDLDAGEFETGQPGAGEQLWCCNFTAIDSQQPFRPPRLTSKPLIQGLQTAIVVGPQGEEIHTDDHARVKVQFHWDRYGNGDENSSCWIRVSQPWAGKGWGSQATPRIGQEVIVEFLEGDPDRPIITGRVYNGDQTPPYGPGSGVVSGLKSNTHKGSGYNEMSMDDTAGKEKITIHGQYDMNTTVEHDQADVVHNNRSSTVDVDDKETIGSNQEMNVGSNQKLSVGADQEVSVSANQKLTVGSDQTNSIGANQKTSVGSNQEVSVGANQKTSVGANQEDSVSGNRKTTVGGSDSLTVSGSETLDASGPIKISSGATIELSVGGSSIKITAGSIDICSSGPVTVKGAVVKVNG